MQPTSRFSLPATRPARWLDLITWPLRFAMKLGNADSDIVYGTLSRVRTAWDVRVYESTDHLLDEVDAWAPHIVFTHWHTVSPGMLPVRWDDPLACAEDLRARYGDGIRDRPMMVAEVSGGDEKFGGDWLVRRRDQAEASDDVWS
jgi:hypothetical protein